MVKCTVVRCQRKTKGDHEYDARECMGINADALQAGDQLLELDAKYINFDVNKPKYRAEVLACLGMEETDPVSEDNYCEIDDEDDDITENKMEPTYAIKEDSVDAKLDLDITGFFEKWSKFDHHATLTDNPEAIFEDLEGTLGFRRYHKLFAEARLRASTLPIPVLSHVMKEFIRESSHRFFKSFDIYFAGAIGGYAGSSKVQVSKLVSSMEANLSTVSHSTSEIKEAVESFHSVVEILRENINKLSAASSKLEANMKIEELQNQQSLPKTSFGAPQSYPSQKSLNIVGYSSGNMFIPIGKDGKVDLETSKLLNSKASQIDKQFINTLAIMGKQALSRVLSVPWDEILPLHTYTPDLDAKQAAIEFYEVFKQRYPLSLPTQAQKYTVTCPSPN